MTNKASADDILFSLAAIAAVLGVVAIAFLVGLTTHASHIAEVKAYHDEMAACIQSNRPAADCRLIVYGSK